MSILGQSSFPELLYKSIREKKESYANSLMIVSSGRQGYRTNYEISKQRRRVDVGLAVGTFDETASFSGNLRCMLCADTSKLQR